MTEQQHYYGAEAAKFVREGEDFAQRNMLNEAISAYEDARKIEPSNVYIRERLKKLYQKRDTARVLAILSDSRPDSSDVLIQDGGATEHVIGKKTKPFQDIGKDAQKEQKSGSERRVHYRMPAQLEVFYRALTAKEKTEGKTINVSAGGLLLVVDQKINLGTFLELRFETVPPDPKPILAVGKVVRLDEIKKDDKTYYGLGIRFTNIKEDDRTKILEIIKT